MYDNNLGICVHNLLSSDDLLLRGYLTPGGVGRKGSERKLPKIRADNNAIANISSPNDQSRGLYLLTS